MILQTRRTPLSMTSDIRWVPVYNDSGEAIPPYSVIRVTTGAQSSVANGSRVYLKTAQPNDDFSTLALTGPQATPIDGYGVATMDSPAWMAWSSADGTPSAGDAYTRGRGVWWGVPGGTDFSVIGPAISIESPKRVLVMQHNRGGRGVRGLDCCNSCIDQKYLLISGLYAGSYIAQNIPVELGGPSVTLEYVGLTGVDPVWESDSFNFTCNAGTDEYFWRMIAGIDMTSTCMASWGPDNVFLYLVKTGSATVCTDLSAPCDDGMIGSIGEQYANIEDWRSRCGSRLYARFPQHQVSELRSLLPCSVCVVPYIGLPASGPTSDCLTQAAADSGRTTPWPVVLNATVNALGATATVALIYTNHSAPNGEGGCSTDAIWTSWTDNYGEFGILAPIQLDINAPSGTIRVRGNMAAGCCGNEIHYGITAIGWKDDNPASDSVTIQFGPAVDSANPISGNFSGDIIFFDSGAFTYSSIGMATISVSE